MKKLFSLFAGLLPLASFAHEGHGHTDGFTIIHYIVEPVHSITIFCTGLLFILAYRAINRKENKG